MNKITLKEKLAPLIEEWNTTSGDSYKILEGMKILMESYLLDHPRDSDILTQLALTVFTVPYADDEAAVKYLKVAIENDKHNLTILLILAYIQRCNYSIENDVLELLRTHKTQKASERALIFYAQSWFYKRADEEKYVALLEESIATYDAYVWPHYYLGVLYKYDENYVESCLHFNKALINVNRVFRPNDFYHIIDAKEFIEERIAGNVISDVNFQMIEESVAECSSNLVGFSAASHC